MPLVATATVNAQTTCPLVAQNQAVRLAKRKQHAREGNMSLCKKIVFNNVILSITEL
jgi:hypothetical protein